ncbi:hypothetical protein GcM1_250264 [Golovinomyces cichoracearum]|uniref:Uncharacterized protein n=1 Tax=Golovinomyces cichoracearum TaxID=62708 RepID=A0A420IBG7_9PEZI|nr:hypothetical protein GcM1_250264 [Golovinomyces cichoracearum]
MAKTESNTGMIKDLKAEFGDDFETDTDDVTKVVRASKLLGIV